MQTAIYDPDQPDSVVLDLGEGELRQTSAHKAQHLMESIQMALNARRFHLEQDSDNE